MDITRRQSIAASSALLIDIALAGCTRIDAGRTQGGLGGQQVGPASESDPAGSRAKRRIVACCDGTLATLKDGTNIAWIATHCEDDVAQPVPQVRVRHFDGVGTRDGERVTGGALGYGLSRQIWDAYRFVRGAWRPDEDEIFLFGFSRGAFAARSLANLIGLVGCLDTDNPKILNTAYRDWYQKARSNRPEERILVKRAAAIVRPHVRPAKIAFLGVFDTVGKRRAPLRCSPGLRPVSP